MSDILEVIRTRKSIRRYKADPIPDEILDKVLEAARWAPTGENYQPWRLSLKWSVVSIQGLNDPHK